MFEMGRLQIALYFLIVCMCSASTGSNFTCKEAERNALLKFKHSLTDPEKTNNLGSWVGEDCCSWEGVVCDNVTSNVIKLDMRFAGAEAVEVNPALLEFKHHLRYLNLNGICFNGSRIPEFLGEMRQLQHLDLSEACFSGKIPHHLGNLTHLVELVLGDFEWVLEEENNLEWAFKLKNLQNLELAGMDLSKSHDSLSLIYKLPSLLYLTLSYCQLGNSHLLIRNLTSYSSALQELDLTTNHFNGPFPYFIQNLSFLTTLYLTDNQFGFSIPSWLVDNRNIEYLDLSSNHFNGMEGGIMNIIGCFCSLKHLELSHNHLQDYVSKSHVNYSRCSTYDLEWLGLSNNNITGELPIIESMSSLQTLDLSFNKLSAIVDQVTLANLSSLRHLDLSSNPVSLDLPSNWMPPFQLEYLHMSSCKINTPFPKWILSQKYISDLDLSGSGIFGHLPNNIGTTMPPLYALELAGNRISGSIPRSLCKLASNSIGLKNNWLSGMIPDCWKMNSSIYSLDLSSNQLSGPIPNSFTKLSSLQFLSLSNNSLEGELPLFLDKLLPNLEVLDVGKNNLHGEIPAWNGSDFPFFQVLMLRENNFKGVIPQQLCSIQSLEIIDLANNALVGTIPHCFGLFKGMSQGPVDDYLWSGVELIKRKKREYTPKLMYLLVNMDLSCNNLVGVIPPNITSSSRLFSLNLSHNHLTGPIPKDIGNLKSLESLDLSCNKLSGSIPESISSIDSLEVLDLSFNNLHGRIPTGSHFQTLGGPSIYMGNPGLCGEPLPNKCSNAHPPTTTVIEDEEEDNKLDKMWFYLVIMLGFATGFWGFIGILVVKKKWRYVFFQLAEDLVDWLYVKVAVRIAQAKREK